jgi:hypothetical protein
MSNGKNLTSLNQPITLTLYLLVLRKGHIKMALKQNKNPPKKIQKIPQIMPQGKFCQICIFDYIFEWIKLKTR